LGDLEAHGLIRRRSGRSNRQGQGNRQNIYEFAFGYAGSTLVHPLDKGLSTRQTTPLSTRHPSPCPSSRPEQESAQQERLQQQPTINLNLTLRQDESIAAAAIELLRRYFDETAAQHIAAKYPPDYIREKVDLVERRARSNRLRNKPGYLRRALEDGWARGGTEAATDEFDRLVASIRRGAIREAVIGDVPWRAGITADRRAIYLTHMTTGAQMRLNAWEDCRPLKWR